MTKVFRSTVVNAPIDDVWEHIRDFNALPAWVPSIGASQIEDGHDSSTVGCIRSLTLAGDGGTVRERLLTLCDANRLCTYSILEAPLPVENYVATLRLLPVSDGDRTYAEWTAEFDTEQVDAMRDVIGNAVFMAGLNTLKEKFGG